MVYTFAKHTTMADVNIEITGYNKLNVSYLDLSGKNPGVFRRGQSQTKININKNAINILRAR